ncbi:MAG: methyltransferase domain-containing protein [Burkholderiales bacterium]|nr:methyltransferase domain-containing protein [Burkholderiales bacterium]
MAETHKAGVIRFYDTHPINEDEILAKLAARGDDLAHLTEDQLKDFDQDHYGGIEVVDTLAARAGIARAHRVLDVCSGMGGPARWLAHRIGCRVTGLDLTLSRVEAARRLTRRVGLDGLVDFVHGDATAMPLPTAAFDRVVSQEAWLHVPDKPAVVRECARVLVPGGVLAFTDVVLRAPLAAHEERRLAAEMHAPGVLPASDYLALLARNGLAVASSEDLSAAWTEILVRRLAMYRGLRDTTVAKFGQAHYDAWDATYGFFVGLFAAGKLGGLRAVATRAAGAAPAR